MSSLNSNSNIHIFILCYNESVLLPHTVAHYRRYLPSAKITIYDNESTDNSAAIARSLGCDVIAFSSENILNDYVNQSIRNQCWLDIASGWILTLDMDEWLCVTESDLAREYALGTTILSVKGVNMIGESQTEDLADIDLHAIRKGVDHDSESKPLCFLRDRIAKMEYSRGGHSCDPVGICGGPVRYSECVYINKHMDILGAPFFIKKMLTRHARAHVMRERGMAGHYITDIDEITRKYYENLTKARDIDILDY